MKSPSGCSLLPPLVKVKRKIQTAYNGRRNDISVQADSSEVFMDSVQEEEEGLLGTSDEPQNDGSVAEPDPLLIQFGEIVVSSGEEENEEPEKVKSDNILNDGSTLVDAFSANDSVDGNERIGDGGLGIVGAVITAENQENTEKLNQKDISDFGSALVSSGEKKCETDASSTATVGQGGADVKAQKLDENALDGFGRVLVSSEKKDGQDALPFEAISRGNPEEKTDIAVSDGQKGTADIHLVGVSLGSAVLGTTEGQSESADPTAEGVKEMEANKLSPLTVGIDKSADDVKDGQSPDGNTGNADDDWMGALAKLPDEESDHSPDVDVGNTLMTVFTRLGVS
jgi:hypothetical protein